MKKYLFYITIVLLLFCKNTAFSQTSNNSCDSTLTKRFYGFFGKNNNSFRKRIYIAIDSFIFNDKNYKHVKKIKSSDIKNIKFKKHQHLIELSNFEIETNDSQVIYTLYYSTQKFNKKTKGTSLWLGSETIVLYLYKKLSDNSIIKVENENNGIIFQN